MKILTFLAAILPAIATAGQIEVAWSPVTERDDGTVVESLGGYYLYFQRVGFEPQKIGVPPDQTIQTTPPVFGLYSVWVTAFETLDGYEFESPPSERLSIFVYPGPIKVQINSVSCPPPSFCETPTQ